VLHLRGAPVNPALTQGGPKYYLDKPTQLHNLTQVYRPAWPRSSVRVSQN